MYRFVKVSYKTWSNPTRWETAPGTTPIGSLVGGKRVVLVHVIDESNDARIVNLNDSAVMGLASIALPTMTVENWVESIVTPLPDSGIVPGERYARYYPLSRSSLTPIAVSRNERTLTNGEMSDKVDIFIPSKELRAVWNDYIFTVDGLVHRAIYDTDGIRLLGGGSTFMRRGEHRIGSIRLADVAPFTISVITPSMILKSGTTPLQELCIIDLPATTANKSIILILGGIIIYQGIMRPVGTGAMELRLNNINYTDTICRILDRTNLPDVVPNNYQYSLNLNTLYSDEVVKNLLTSERTFLIILDTPEISKSYVSLEPTQLPNRYIRHTGEDYPVVTDEGVMLEYERVLEYDRYVLHTTNNLNTPYRLIGTYTPENTTIDWSEDPSRDIGYFDAYSLLLTSDKR